MKNGVSQTSGVSHMLLSKNSKLLLVDLDGALIATQDSNNQAHQLIYSLHGEHTSHALENSNATIAILTHRHKAEAEQILNFLGINDCSIIHCYTAQDLWNCARKYKRVSQTLLKGLRKSLILPLIKEELGYHPRDIAIIDDRPEILSDMSNEGVGLTLLCPFDCSKSDNFGYTTTFDLTTTLQVFIEWSGKTTTAPRQQIILKEREIPNNTLFSNSRVIIRNRWGLFTFGRKAAQVIRRNIFEKSEQP